MREYPIHQIYSKVCDILTLLDLYEEDRKQERLEEIRSIAREILKII
jgi:hypothetical protein